jgi:nucleotide-binding universal stress UspA family protein
MNALSNQWANLPELCADLIILWRNGENNSSHCQISQCEVNMSERILMPLDGSKMGEAALAYVDQHVARLAPGETVELTLFHVVTAVRHKIPYQGAGMASIPYNDDELSRFKEQATAYLETVSKKFKTEKLNIFCKVAVNENPAEAIIDAEQELNCDLVAMSTHGRSGISRFTVGSVAEKVLRGGGVPVLMVRAEES